MEICGRIKSSGFDMTLKKVPKFDSTGFETVDIQKKINRNFHYKNPVQLNEH